MALSATQAKSLCTASELTLVKASTRNEIGKHSAAQLRQKIERARDLRDKWRDPAMSQRRATQAARHSRQTGANARSAEKAELFGEVLARFEARLAALEAQGEKSRPAPQRLPTRARSATHRADRADIRTELKEERLAMGVRKKPKPPKKAKAKTPVATLQPIVEAFESAAIPITNAPRKPSIPVTKAGQGKRAHAGAGMTAIESARALQGLHVTKGKQLRAQTAAKKSRLQQGGILRIQTNASSRNKRRQGKRDAR